MVCCAYTCKRVTWSDVIGRKVSEYLQYIEILTAIVSVAGGNRMITTVCVVVRRPGWWLGLLVKCVRLHTQKTSAQRIR